MIDHYRLLQVRRDASDEVISAAYRRLIKNAHPDRGGDSEDARRLNAAYATLSDPERRRAYDRTLGPEGRHPQRELLPEIAYRLGVGLGRLLRKSGAE